MDQAIGGYVYQNAEATAAHNSLLPTVARLLACHAPPGSRLLDLGCGNGYVSNWIAEKGYSVVGVDASDDGIPIAAKAYPAVEFHHASVYDPLSERLGQFSTIVSLEVVEHLYSPRDYMREIANLLKPGGKLIISTPYHGYMKNLALALSGKMDSHFTALWDNGHIKFWSRETLTVLLEEQQLKVVSFDRVGRIAPLAMSMVLVAEAPQRELI